MTDQPGRDWANPAWGEPTAPPFEPPPAPPAEPGQGPGSPPAGGNPPAGTPYPPPGTPYPPPGTPYAPPGAPYPPTGAPYAPPGGGYGATPYRANPYGAAYPPPAAAPKPGVVPLRPLGVGEVLDGAITTIRRHPRITIGLAAMVVTVQQVISVAAQVSTGSIGGSLAPSGGSLPSGMLSGLDPFSTVAGLVLSAVNLLLGTVLGAILTGILMVVVSESVLGRSIELGEVWRRVRPRFWALLGGSILAGLLPWSGVLIAGLVGLAVGLAAGTTAGVVVGVILGLVLLVPGAYLWGVLALTTPAITLERLGPLKGLRRSWQLARGDFWRVWGIRALASVIAYFLSGIIVVPFEVVGAIVLFAAGFDADTTGLLILLAFTAVGAIMAGSVVQPFLAGVIGLLYVDRRMRGEGLDIILQEQARTAQAGQPVVGWT